MTPDDFLLRWGDAPERAVPPPPSGATLAEHLARIGHPLDTRCGQRGQCQGCTVELLAGGFRTHAGSDIAAPAVIQACGGTLRTDRGPTRLAVPARSFASRQAQAVSTFKCRVPVGQSPLVPLRAGDADHGLAIDLGTTTVVVALVELPGGRIVGDASGFNRQIDHGDNVLTRIEVAATPEGRDALRRVVLDHSLAPLITSVCTAAGIPPARIAGGVIAGNTTMLHLLVGADPTSLGIAPFRAAFLDHRVVSAADLGLPALAPEAPFHLLPGISAYVGADLIAGAACTGLTRSAGPALLVDLGTNGEILLWHRGRLLAAATAAGPAFEGGRLSCGMRATSGAIAHVRFAADGIPEVTNVIGGGPARGLCGSAYVDFLAGSRASGLLAATGRWNPGPWRQLPAAHRRESAEGRGVLLAPDNDATLVTERDVAELSQARAAVAAGIEILLRRAGIAAADVRRVCLAGGFGLHLDVRHAIACGLLPDFTPAQVDVVGNTSLGGAWLALSDRSFLDEMASTARTAELVELNLEPGFEDAFIDRLVFA